MTFTAFATNDIKRQSNSFTRYCRGPADATQEMPSRSSRQQVAAGRRRAAAGCSRPQQSASNSHTTALYAVRCSTPSCLQPPHTSHVTHISACASLSGFCSTCQICFCGRCCRWNNSTASPGMKRDTPTAANFMDCKCNKAATPAGCTCTGEFSSTGECAGPPLFSSKVTVAVRTIRCG